LNIRTILYHIFYIQKYFRLLYKDIRGTFINIRINALTRLIQYYDYIRFLLLIDRSSIPVAFLLVLDVCGVICGMFYVLSLLFCSSSCCLCGDLSLLGFDRAMFVDLKKTMVIKESEL
jgi:hypothetical protein